MKLHSAALLVILVTTIVRPSKVFGQTEEPEETTEDKDKNKDKKDVSVSNKSRVSDLIS